MVFGIFKKKDPICGMKKEKNKGMIFENKWFCSNECKMKFEKRKTSKPSCCH